MEHPQRKKKWDEFTVQRAPEEDSKKQWKDNLVSLIGGLVMAGIVGGLGGGLFGFMMADETQTHREVWAIIAVAAIVGALLAICGWIYLWMESRE